MKARTVAGRGEKTLLTQVTPDPGHVYGGRRRKEMREGNRIDEQTKREQKKGGPRRFYPLLTLLPPQKRFHTNSKYFLRTKRWVQFQEGGLISRTLSSWGVPKNSGGLPKVSKLSSN